MSIKKEKRVAYGKNSHFPEKKDRPCVAHMTNTHTIRSSIIHGCLSCPDLCKDPND